MLEPRIALYTPCTCQILTQLDNFLGNSRVYSFQKTFSRFQDWIPKVGRITRDSSKTLFAIKCLCEIQNVSVMKSSASCMRQSGKTSQECEVFGCSISPVEFTALFEFLSYIKNFQKLSIYSCTMENFAFRELAKLLIRDNEITELFLQRVDMNDRNIKAIADVLSNGKCKLTTLHINTNRLTDESAKYLSDALKNNNCKLTYIDISDNDLRDLGANYLSDGLKSDSCKLTHLIIRNNYLRDKGAKHLSSALKSNKCKLTNLDISENHLGDEGVKYLSDALMNDNCKLTHLDIHGNELTDEGARHLSDALKTDNCKLVYLHIGRNELTGNGSKYLSDAVKSKNCKLTSVFTSLVLQSE